MGKYSILYRPDLLQVFWAGMQAGDFITDAVIPLNTSRRTGRTVLAAAGGVRPRRGRNLKGRCLTFAQREEIAILRAQGQSLRRIGRGDRMLRLDGVPGAAAQHQTRE